jgi:hypothetical protein
MSAVLSRVTPHRVAGKGRLCASAGETVAPVKSPKAARVTANRARPSGLLAAPPANSGVRGPEVRVIRSKGSRSD